jgi:chromate reductase, NAD(P)H dehydrogenase (quinone)
MSIEKNILAISGSLRAGSSNQAILSYLGKLAGKNITYNIYNGLADIPHFDPGLDNDNPSAAVALFRDVLAKADGIIICTPEYAYGVPGTLKNALDWTVSSGSLSEKPLALITASTGGENAHAALLLILHALNAKVAEDGALLISFIRSKMDAKGNITDEATKNAVGEAFNQLLKATNI